jgi:hypothetical protein
MTNKEFIALVFEMRSAQKKYFRTRNQSYLQEAKNLEKRVDAAISVTIDLDCREKNNDYGFDFESQDER